MSKKLLGLSLVFLVTIHLTIDPDFTSFLKISNVTSSLEKISVISLIINDITEIFSRDDVSFEIFKKLVKAGSKVRCISTKNTKDKPRSFFDGIDKWAKEQGASGLAYFTIEKDSLLKGKGPVGKFFSSESIEKLMEISKANVEIVFS